MSENGPVFVDCTADIAPYLDEETRALVPGLDIHFDAPADEAELVARLEGRRSALVYMAYLSRPVLQALPQLKTVVYLATGLATHADMEAVAEFGVDLVGVKGYGDRAVAEHTVILALAGLRRVAEADRAVRAGRFDLTMSEEFHAKTFGIVGLGGIGREAANIATALGMRAIAWNRTPALAAGVEMGELDDVVAESDILSLHLALGEETKGIIDARRLAAMKPGAVLVNTARAELVDEAALLAGLAAGRPAHAALDVFHAEPPAPDHPLLALPNVTLTSHSAWFTPQAISRLLRGGFSTLAAKTGAG